jgi:3-deoxy-7-phosphoheptulonate synthase
MLLVLNPNLSENDIIQLIQKLKWMGLDVIRRQEEKNCHIAILNDAEVEIDIRLFSTLPGVLEIHPFTQKFKLAGKQFKKRTVIQLKNSAIGDGSVAVMAGPCSVESEEQIMQTAQIASQEGATILRGGAFKPRTSPYDFQGLGKEGLHYLNQAADHYGLSTISEVMDTRDVEWMADVVDILQVGARNMQNFNLLKEVGKANKPVLLKRGFAATYQDFLMAAEYILAEGNPHVILCERGIRTFETYTRNTLDIAAVPVLQELSHLPVIIDPSHATGMRKLITPMARAAVAAGADGLMVEVHPNPDAALSDSKQSIDFAHFAELMRSVRRIEAAMKD